MKQMRYAVYALIVTIASSACEQPSSESTKPAPISPPTQTDSGKKLIQIGYDSPSAALIAKNIQNWQDRPFDGIVFNLDPENNQADQQTPARLLDPRVWRESELALETLRRVAWGRFTHNFLRVDTVYPDAAPQWFDDARWEQISANMKLLARAARAAKAKGIVLDNEPYGVNPWEFRAGDYPEKSLVQVQQAVYRRGAQVMAALQSEFADIQVLTLFGLSIVRAQQAEANGDLEKVSWVYWASFLDGMLGVINPQAQIIDGHEGSYYHTSAEEFESFRDYFAGSRELLRFENRAKYDAQFRIAHAVYVDGLLNLWKSPSLFGYYLASDNNRQRMLEHNLYHGLKNSNQYVWIYNENMDWWNTKGAGVNIPAGLDAALRSVKARVAAGQPLGFDIEGFAPRARAGYDQRLYFGGKIIPNGLDIGGVRVRSGPPIGLEREDSACNTERRQPGYWEYRCVLPRGWTGTLTPTLEGVRFDPPTLKLNNAITGNEAADFRVRP